MSTEPKYTKGDWVARDEDGDFVLGGTDVYPTPEPEWGETSETFVGPVAIYRTGTTPPDTRELVTALEKIADIAKRNFGRQNEKLADIEPIARAALSAIKGGDR